MPPPSKDLTWVPMRPDEPTSPATEPIGHLLRRLRARPEGLSASEVEHRQVVYGPNEIARRGGRRWLPALGRQFVHPFALLLWAATAVAYLEGTRVLALAIVAVLVANAVVAFIQEIQAERAVEALREYLPEMAHVLRAGQVTEVPARDLVPGDVLLVEAGGRIPADARLLEGTLQVDLSSLTGESAPVGRTAAPDRTPVPLLEARDIVFSGTACTRGSARAVVFATGMQTELGRIAALSERVTHEPSPLEKQIRKLAWTIAALGVLASVGFFLVGVFFAGLSIGDALAFATGLLVANVPEGLLPTLTLALAVGVRVLARTGALVKRLSAVETLGASTVICTDKTGTLTENRMQVTDLWSMAGALSLDPEGGGHSKAPDDPLWKSAAHIMAVCNEAVLQGETGGQDVGDPTEVGLLRGAAALGAMTDEEARHAGRRALFPFDAELKIMSTLDALGGDGGDLELHTKGAPEEVLVRCESALVTGTEIRVLSDPDRDRILEAIDQYAARGLRVLALARRPWPDGREPSRGEAERSLTFVGLVAMQDPPRPEVPDAVARCRRAGIRVIMITGDHGTTAAAMARRVGLVDRPPRIVTGRDLERLHDHDLGAILRDPEPVVFARASPETKLRITDVLKGEGHVVAMTGDGVNDAPALRRADIGVAMGKVGTDVAREAATVILTDDNFATIVTAVGEGRRIYDNIRKFTVYVLAHLTPEVVPFLLFALSGGAIPLPMTVLQILLIDLGTETLPALALGRERAEAGLMERPPRTRSEGVVEPALLLRSWLLLGGVSAVLVMGGFLLTLWWGGWSPGAPVGPGTDLHEVHLTAMTMTFLGIVVCQIGTGFASRTERVSLRAAGVFGNPFLLWGLLFALALAAVAVYVPLLQPIFQTVPPPPELLLLLVPFPFIVWGADELHKRWRR